MGKMKILIAILIIAAIAFFFFNPQNQAANCEHSQNQSECYSKLAIDKADEKICEKLSGAKKEECLYEVDIVKTTDVCDAVNEKFDGSYDNEDEKFDDRILDLCAEKFPERFAKLDCSSLGDPDFVEYCRQKQK